MLLNRCLTIVVKWLGVNELKLNPVKAEVMRVGKAEVLRDIAFPTFGGVQLTLLPQL